MNQISLPFLVIISILGCSANPTPMDASVTIVIDAGTVSEVDAGTDAGLPMATKSIGPLGGMLELGSMRMNIPAGALGNMVSLEVRQSAEAAPVISGVTPITPVFEFGPNGTTFLQEVSVTFGFQSPVTNELPIVFWSQADGTFAPVPSWWSNDMKTHALTSHFSKAFVGRVTTQPATLKCCGGSACNARGVCVDGEAKGLGKIVTDIGTYKTLGVEVGFQTVATPSIARSVSYHQTPVRPSDENIAFEGSVFDIIVAPFSAGEVLNVCVAVKAGTPTAGTCLGYFDEVNSKWKCQDTCIEAQNGVVCGKTNHLTNFAILLTGSGAKGAKCGSSWP